MANRAVQVDRKSTKDAPRFRRTPAGIAGDPTVAVGGLLGGGLGRVGRVGAAAVAVARIGYHDDIRLDLAEVGVVQAPAPHHPGRVVLHDHIADPHQLAEQLPGPRVGQVQGQRAFAPVDQIVGGSPVPPVLPVLTLGKGTRVTPAAGHVGAPRAFDLDHLSPQVGQ